MQKDLYMTGLNQALGLSIYKNDNADRRVPMKSLLACCASEEAYFSPQLRIVCQDLYIVATSATPDDLAHVSLPQGIDLPDAYQRVLHGEERLYEVFRTHDQVGAKLMDACKDAVDTRMAVINEQRDKLRAREMQTELVEKHITMHESTSLLRQKRSDLLENLIPRKVIQLAITQSLQTNLPEHKEFSFRSHCLRKHCQELLQLHTRTIRHPHTTWSYKSKDEKFACTVL